MPTPSNPRFETLLRIIDKFCQDAPKELAPTYRPDPIKYPEKAKQAKARAYGHLYLLVRFGITDFRARERLITDGEQDGGLDAYFIDNNNQTVYLVQFKFHHSSQAFENEAVGPGDLMKTEYDRILRGDLKDSLGVPFNGKIHRFQKEFQKTPGFKPVVVLFGLVKLDKVRLKKLIGDFSFEIYNAKRVYEELIFRLCAGDYSTPEKVTLHINKKGKKHISLEQEIEVKSGKCGVKVVFAPTQEIGKITAQYKNSILRHNPRNYLSLSQNSVNERISESVKRQKTNEFSILNNGITILSDEAEINPNTGSSQHALLTLKNPPNN